MRPVILILALVFSFVAGGVQAQCLKYSNQISQGQKFLRSNNPTRAFECFRNAQSEGKVCNLKSTIEAEEGMKKAFDALIELKKRADNAERIAKENESRATTEKQNAERISDSLKRVKTFVQEFVSKQKEFSSEETKKYAAMGIDVEEAKKVGAIFQGISVDTLNANSVNYVSTLSFYVKAKRVLDSLNTLAKDGNASLVNTREDETYMASVISRLELDYEANKIAPLLRDSVKAELARLNEDAKDYHLLAFVYARASVGYAYRLIELNELAAAKTVIDESYGAIQSLRKNTAIKHFSLSMLQNAYRYYYGASSKPQEAYNWSVQSIEDMTIAVASNPGNSFYQRALSVYLRNATSAPDSLLPPKDKGSLARLGCQCANNIVSLFPKSGKSLEPLAECSRDEADKYIGAGNYTQAVNILKLSLIAFNRQISNTPHKKDVYLQKSRILTKISDVYIRHVNDTILCRAYLDSAIQNWLAIFRDEDDPIVYFDQAKKVFDNVCTISEVINDNRLRKEINEKIISAISNFPAVYLMRKEILSIISLSNKNLGQIYDQSKVRSDSVKALGYFVKSVSDFEKGPLMSTYTEFSEDIEKYCYSYRACISTYLKEKDYQKAGEYYSRMIETFSGYYKKFPWDFYFVLNFMNASASYGAYLYHSGQAEQAVPALELASAEANKSSSQMLISIYGDSTSKLYDTAALHRIQIRIGYQSDGMKRFTIPTQFGDTKLPFDVYVIDRDPKSNFAAIEDQAIWVAQAKSGIIPPEVTESFRKLQALAWKNKVSYGELSEYALNAANEDKVLPKYNPLKDSVEASTNYTQKSAFYERLASIYDYDLRNSKEYLSIIKKDAVVFYNQYARYQINHKEIKLGRQIIRRIYELDSVSEDAYENVRRIDYIQDKARIMARASEFTSSDLLLYLGFCLEDLDYNNASYLCRKILDKSDNIDTRYVISKVYYNKTGSSNYKEMFLSDTSTLAGYWVTLNKQDISSLSHKQKRLFYLNLIELDMAMMNINNADVIKSQTAIHYNSVAYESFFTKQYDDIFYYLNKSIEYDSSSLYAYSNFPHAYLFTNNFEKAVELYTKFKDQPFDVKSGYATFKEGFLVDFKDFEAAGLMNENIKRITAILQAN